MCSSRQDVQRRSGGWVRARQAWRRGLSIVELMVGLVVALLVSLAVVNAAISFTASQRQGIGATGAAMGGVTALASLKDDISVAGLGFFGDSTYLCQNLNFSVGATRVSDGAAFSPLQVRRTADGDVVDIVFGTRVESGANVRLRETSDGNSSTLESFLPASVGDAVLLAPSNPASGQPCLVRSVTQVTPATPTSAQLLTFGSAGRHNAVSFSTPPFFDDDARITQLGAVNWVRYRVVGGNLVAERPLDGTTVIVARQVVSFRMQFGVSANAPGSTTLEAWVSPTGDFATVNAVNLPRIRAVRLGLIVRSPQLEKRNAAGECTAADAGDANKPRLWDNPPDNLAGPDWNCWRYRTSTAVAPLRNLVLGQQ